LSNKIYLLIAGILAAAILGDGTLYSRPSPANRIFSNSAPEQITVTQHGNVLMEFSRKSERWLLTKPQIAPASEARIQTLLDSNMHNHRSYAATQLPVDKLFTDSVIVQIDDHRFSFGQIEPVSQQRYVQAGDKIYLQPDEVIPVLQAGSSAFIDLQITRKVSSVSVNNHDLPDIDIWNNLKALGIVSMNAVTPSPVTSVIISDKEADPSVLYIYSIDQSLVLQPENASYGFLLSSAQAKDLGLADYVQVLPVSEIQAMPSVD